VRGDWLRQCARSANHDLRGEEVTTNFFRRCDARRRGDDKLLPPMRCGTGKGQVVGCGVAPTDYSVFSAKPAYSSPVCLA
jgi:hypothetical protein